jgi:thioredoxin
MSTSPFTHPPGGRQDELLFPRPLLTPGPPAPRRHFTHPGRAQARPFPRGRVFPGTKEGTIRLSIYWAFRMANVTVIYSQTCGACPAAKDLWKGLRVKYSFGYREVDILSPDGQELAERHSIRATPATLIDGRLKFIGVPSRESAEKALGIRKEG